MNMDADYLLIGVLTFIFGATLVIVIVGRRAQLNAKRTLGSSAGASPTLAVGGRTVGSVSTGGGSTRPRHTRKEE